MQYNINEIDQSVFNEMRFLMKAKFSLVLDEYLEDSNKYIWNIQKAVQSRSLDNIIAASHPLKSSSMALGFVGLGHLAKEIELTAKAAVQSGRGFDADMFNMAAYLDEAYAVVKHKIRAM